MKEKHVHKLRRHIYKSNNVIYFCMLPDCSFKIVAPLALGKRSICHRCGQEFIMNEYSIRLAKPHCMDCHKSKSEPVMDSHTTTTTNTTTIEIDDDPMSHIIKRDPIESMRAKMNAITTKEDEEI